jgi:two-component system, cell cycle response regulator
MADTKRTQPRPKDMATVVAEAGPASTARSRGVLTVLSGPETGRVVSVGPEGVRLGRSEDCHVSFDDASLSRVHARAVRLLGTQFFLGDEGSTNGTFVNGVRLARAVELSDGDRIQLGTATHLRFAIVDEAEEAALVRVYQSGRLDGLTGIANRAAFDERLDKELAFAVRHESPLSIALFDVDHFKKINDTFGHPAGDEVLKGVAATLSRAVRTEDVAARYGGEEFVVVMRELDVGGARMLADRLRESVAAQTVTAGDQAIRLTVSAGVASLACCAPEVHKAALVAKADARLYLAKQGGRNRVVSE